MNGLDEAGTYGANVANPYDGSFIDTAFSDEEQDALGFSTVINNGNSYRIGEPIGASDLTQDKLFPLSLDEAMNEDYGFSTDMNEDAARVATESYNNQPFVWWLRSPDEASEEIGEGTFVVSTGAIEANGGWVYNPFMVRPAFHLDYGSVLLSTAADFDNSSAFAHTEQYNGDDWKLTLKDGNTDFGAGMEHTTIARGDTATVAIDDLGEGADYTQISAMLIRSGDIYAYGRIGSASTGEKSFTIPANLPVGDYTLRLFAEEVNGEYLTSYASNTVDMEITVTYPPYPVGTRLKLTGGSAWFVLEDGVEHFTLVRDGFLSGTHARFGADTLITAEQAIEDYQTEAREIFDDDGAATRLPALSEFENIISGSIHFSDQDTAFWLSDEYVNDLPGDTGYYYAEGDSYYNWRSRDDFIAVRPVLMVSKAAFLAVEPVITEQPADLQFFTLYGNDAVFSVTATGTNVTYQWQVYDGSYWVNLDGETASRLTLDRNDENYAEGKTFRCELDSDWGEPVYTDEAQLLLGNWLQYGLEYAQPGTDYTVSADENTVTVHTAAGLEIFETWAVIGSENGGYPSFGPPAPSGGGGGDSAVRTITVTETSSPLFRGSLGAITAQANMEKAFSDAVEVKVTDTNEDAAAFGLGEGNAVYPFDISLYIRGTNTRTQPAPGYAVTISLPVPESLLDKKEQLDVIHKSDNGIVTTCSSRLEHRAGVWYLVFEATEFSPYALVVRSAGIYEGVPYYLDDSGSKVFIGFAANGKYIAPDGVTVSVMGNSKSFVDVSGHWAAGYIGFVTEREIFLGTGGSAFSPDSGMTRAMFATVIGRLYERSYGTIEASGVHAFTDCDYGAYYGRYVDWAERNNIIGGYGNGRFSPDNQITREQMATILYRFADFLEILPSDMDTALSYPDAESVSNYAKNAALFCQTTGVISGRSGGVFAPKETATRAEVAAIIERFVELIVN